MKKIFITGGSGFIGSFLVKKLLNEGHQVVVFDDFSRGKNRRLSDVSNRIKIVNGDVRNEKLLSNSCKGCDYFIHLAAINGTKYFYEKPQEVLDVAIKGMLSAINSCYKNKIKNFIFSSSSEVYQTPSIIPTPENVPLVVPDVFNPRYSYGAGKLISEVMLLNYFSSFFKKVIIFRPHNVYGPDMGFEHVIPEMIQKAINAKKKPFVLKGNGKQTRSFIYIEDFIDALYKVIKYGKNRNIYHIGNNDEITILSLAKKILKYFTKIHKIKSSKVPEGETFRRCPEIRKIKKLGYVQNFSIEEGLAKTVVWYKKNVNLKES